MEFYRHIDREIAAEALQAAVTVAALPSLSPSIETLLEDDGDRGRAWTLWGEFEIHREIIRRGVRFTFPGCPNALAWTVTAEPGTGPHPGVVFHASINRTEHDADFIATLDQFADEWQDALARLGS